MKNKTAIKLNKKGEQRFLEFIQKNNQSYSFVEYLKDFNRKLMFNSNIRQYEDIIFKYGNKITYMFYFDDSDLIFN